MKGATRRWVLRVAALLGFFALAGVTYQGVATALERGEFPRPGRLVDVGGHQLHIACQGGGTPTVVLDAAAAFPRRHAPEVLVAELVRHERRRLHG